MKTPTPTPETDASRHDLSDYGIPVPCSYGDWVPFNVAERLERELSAVTEQRDEAREEINSVRRTLSKNGEAVGNGEYNFTIIEIVENLIRSKHYFVRKSDSLERERDEAREQRDRLADLVKQFIHILDITEESDSGRLFHPTNITSCRVGDLQKAGQLVEALRRAVKGGSDDR